MLDSYLNSRLKKREVENSLRKLSLLENLVDFTSNDYLGLARSEELHALIQNKTAKLPHLNGATGSRLLSGNNSYTEHVESFLAKLFQAEACLIFNSGYAANQGILSSIPQRGDTILYDELAHACIRDGARLSTAVRMPFGHNDLNDLESKLKKTQGNVFIAVESIYSMDGDQCPLEELVLLAEKYNATLVLDEAHSTGVLGNKGSGLACQLNLESRIPIRVYTFGKAMGTHGACVVGSKTLINYLVNFARPFIFSTAMPIHSIAAIECAFKYLAQESILQKELTDRVNTFISCVKETGLSCLPSKSQIQGIIVPGNEEVKKTSNALKLHGVDARPILSPTVAKGSERIRICIHTYNTEEQIKQLVQHLAQV